MCSVTRHKSLEHNKTVECGRCRGPGDSWAISRGKNGERRVQAVIDSEQAILRGMGGYDYTMSSTLHRGN